MALPVTPDLIRNPAALTRRGLRKKAEPRVKPGVTNKQTAASRPRSLRRVMHLSAPPRPHVHKCRIEVRGKKSQHKEGGSRNMLPHLPTPDTVNRRATGNAGANRPDGIRTGRFP